MNIKNIIGVTKLFLVKNSPVIALASGIVLHGVAIVEAIRKTPKANDIVKESNASIDSMKKDLNDDEKIANGIVDPKQLKIDIRKKQASTLVKLSKNYAVAGLSFVAATALDIYSYRIMRGRNLALNAALTATTTALNSYRAKVAEKLGEAAENDIYKDSKKKTVEQVNKETGEIENVEVYSPDVYQVFFTASNMNWEKNTSATIDFLQRVEKECNLILRTQGYLFLSTVFDMLGINQHSDKGSITKEQLKMSRSFGWIWDPSNDNIDSWVSFGIADEAGNLYPEVQALLGERNADILLTFNVDGDITQSGGPNFNKLTYMDVASNVK